MPYNPVRPEVRVVGKLPRLELGRSEVLAHLVVATVFKTAARGVNRRAGGFDSHALPLIVLRRFVMR